MNYLWENSDDSFIGDFIGWDWTLHRRLIEKHNETFWIAADSTFIDGNEYFSYKKIEHTKKPLTANAGEIDHPWPE